MLKANVLPVWKSRPATDISRADVQMLVSAIAERGAPVLANRVLSLVRKIFNFATEQDWPLMNPCTGVRRPTVETRRERVLTRDEIKRIWVALDEEEPFFAAFYRLRLLTAQRGGEVRRMRWDQIDFESSVWSIPASVAKNKNAHRVPLSRQAVRVIEDLRTWQAQRLLEINQGRRKKGWPLRESSDYVFPTTSGDGPIEWVQRIANRVRERSGVDDFYPHDLRRTAATLMEEAGTSQFVIAKILNHIRRDQTATYARYGYDTEARVALERWGNEVDRFISAGQSACTVLPMKAAIS